MVDRPVLDGSDAETEQAAFGGLNGVRRARELFGASQGSESCPFPEDRQLAQLAAAGEQDAQSKVFRLISRLKICDKYVRFTSVCVDGDQVRSVMYERLVSSPAFLRSYQGRAPLNVYLAQAAQMTQFEILRRESRRAKILRRMVEPQLADAGRGESRFVVGVGHVFGTNSNTSRAECDRLVRRIMCEELGEEFFCQGGAGAPLQLRGGCGRGLLDGLHALSAMHITVITEMRAGIRAAAACASFLNSASTVGSRAERRLASLYEECGIFAYDTVCYGSECVLDILDVLREVTSWSKTARPRWYRDHQAQFEQLVLARTNLASVLRKRAA
jgi:hypothetical protein